MKKNLSLGGVVLGMLAASLAGCADEEATGKPDQVKSAITARGFVANGCTGTGIFDIHSNDLISYVALDQSSFSSVNAEVFALDQNNQEQLIASTQSSSAISSSLAQLLNEVTNYTSAEQLARQLSAQATSSYQNAYANNLNASRSIATTHTTTDHAADSYSRQFTRTNASGHNEQISSSDVNSWSNAANSARSWSAANAAQLNARFSEAENFANASQHTDATQGAINVAASARNAATAADSFNAVHSNANSGASSLASNFSRRAADFGAPKKVGFGIAGMGWGDISVISSFNNSEVFNDQFANAVNSTRAAASNSAHANVFDTTFSNVFSDANQSSYSNVGSRAIDRAISSSYANNAQANQVSNRSNAHNDQRTFNAYDTSDFRELIAGSNERLSTADSATTINTALNENTSIANQAANAGSRARSLNRSEQLAASQSRNSSLNQQLNRQYQVMENLSRYNANSLVVRLTVTANSEDAVIRMFTGNNTNNVAASQDFVQKFAGCGLGAAVVTPKLTPNAILPAEAAEEATVEPLGDRVAKPE